MTYEAFFLYPMYFSIPSMAYSCVCVGVISVIFKYGNSHEPSVPRVKVGRNFGVALDTIYQAHLHHGFTRNLLKFLTRLCI